MREIIKPFDKITFKRLQNSELIDESKISVEEWLELIDEDDPHKIFTNVCFPTEEIEDDYFKNIKDRKVEDVKRLLHQFLISSGTLGFSDKMAFDTIESAERGTREFDLPSVHSYFRRLLFYGLGYSKIPPWEGITWIIDLLPDSPKKALDALNGYFEAHIQLLPDSRFDGLLDAAKIIRAKFIGTPDSKSEYIQLLKELEPREFEILVEKLYKEMGYETILTPPQKDGGRDIKAIKSTPGQLESLLVECKRYNKVVRIETVRALLGVVRDEKANKGAIVSTGNFTKDAQNFAERNFIELVDGSQLIVLLNEHLGTDWTLNIERLLTK